MEASLQEFVDRTGLWVRVKALPSGMYATLGSRMAPGHRLIHILVDDARLNKEELLRHIAGICRGVDASIWFGDWCMATGHDAGAKASRKFFKRALKLRRHARGLFGPEAYNLLVHGRYRHKPALSGP